MSPGVLWSVSLLVVVPQWSGVTGSRQDAQESKAFHPSPLARGQTVQAPEQYDLSTVLSSLPVPGLSLLTQTSTIGLDNKINQTEEGNYDKKFYEDCV